jgi:RimJ/RimL family protein N-acetyltransferase
MAAAMHLTPPDPPLADDLIRLPQLALRHAAGMVRLSHYPEVVENTYVPSSAPPDFAESWIARYVGAWEDGSRAGFAIEDREGAFLGFAALVSLDLAAKQAEAGYMLTREARGRGVASRALDLVTAWSFDTLGLERIELKINAGNAASERVAERCGYRHEGTLRSVAFKEGRRVDLGIWSRLRSDP